MQLKAGILAAIVAASSVSATPIENGLTQKHVVIQHDNKICISKHQVDACVTGNRATSFRKINMPVVCREQFDDQYIVRAQSGEQLEEIHQATATDFVQRKVPRNCVDEHEEESEQQSNTRDNSRRAQWKPIRGAHANKHMINESASESDQYLNLKLARFTENLIPRFQNEFQKYQQEKTSDSNSGSEMQEWETVEKNNVSEQIRTTWKKLSLERMMRMSEKEHQKINQYLRLMLAQKPSVAQWLFHYEGELPMVYATLAKTLREFMLQPYWTEDEQVSKVLSHQYNTVANRIWTYVVKQLVVLREQQQNKTQQTTVPELEEIVQRVWEEAKKELRNNEIETSERNYNKFLHQLKEQKPEQYKKMFKIFNQVNLAEEESRKIAKNLLQLLISSFLISTPERQNVSESSEQEQQQYNYQPSNWNEEELKQAEQQLRDAIRRDWNNDYERHFESNYHQNQNQKHGEEQDFERSQDYETEQQWTDKQAQQQNGLFNKLRVVYQRFANNIKRVSGYN